MTFKARRLDCLAEDRRSRDWGADPQPINRFAYGTGFRRCLESFENMLYLKSEGRPKMHIEYRGVDKDRNVIRFGIDGSFAAQSI